MGVKRAHLLERGGVESLTAGGPFVGGVSTGITCWSGRHNRSVIRGSLLGGQSLKQGFALLLWQERCAHTYQQQRSLQGNLMGAKYDAIRVVEAAHLHSLGGLTRVCLTVRGGDDSDLSHCGVEAGQQPAPPIIFLLHGKLLFVDVDAVAGTEGLAQCMH
ncbi:MAG: hypothetical protein FRX49_05159 [Trebouxia sp. A1-2]|nr:MAG: hypothetical protein FRX49_05159 [Trebouxia sp. A1-2]